MGTSSDNVPDPPSTLPAYIVEALQRQDKASLQQVIAYAQQVAGQTPSNPQMTTEFESDDIDIGVVVRHSSKKETVNGQSGQVSRVLGDEGVVIWDSHGELKTIRKDAVTEICTESINRGYLDRIIRDYKDNE